jgi:hypothetical protein
VANTYAGPRRPAATIAQRADAAERANGSASGAGGSGGALTGRPSGRGRARRGLRLTPGWPLSVLILGFPVWWALGVSELLVFILIVPMTLRLIGRRGIVVPRGFGWWMVFLFWMLLGLPLLFSDAPLGIPGGGGARVPIFLYRVAWYAACTIVLLWIGNLDEKDLPSIRITRLIGWLFVVSTAGGLLGVLLPHFEFDSLIQLALGNNVGQSEFIKSIAHPQAASIQKLLGDNDARPMAPFPYSNTWGSMMALCLPYFLISWLGPASGWRRLAAPVILVVAAVPIIFSLNRGLWACLAVGGVVLAIRLAFSGRVTALVALGLTITLAGGLLMASPLGDTLIERLNNGKSNGRRGQLLTETVKSTVQGSPVAGFGSTRKVQGSFDSIAGGATPDCKACGVPPLGTQGHIWLVIFSQGIGGLVFFLAFFFHQFGMHWRSRTTLEAAGTIILVFFAVQLFIYDTLGWPMFVIMMAIALMWRERWRGMSAQAEAAQ